MAFGLERYALLSALAFASSRVCRRAASSGGAFCEVEGVDYRRPAWRRMVTSVSVLIRHALAFLDHTPQHGDQLDQNNDTAAAMPLKLVLHTGLSGASSGRPQV